MLVLVLGPGAILADTAVSITTEGVCTLDVDALALVLAAAHLKTTQPGRVQSVKLKRSLTQVSQDHRHRCEESKTPRND